MTSQPSNYFSVATAGIEGVKRSQLYGPMLERPHHGARARAGLNTWEDDVRALFCVIHRSAALSHASAARWMNLPLPSTLLADDVIRVTVPLGVARVRRPGVRCAVATRCGIEFKGLRVTHPGDLWIDLATSLNRVDHIALGDAILRRWPDADLPDWLSQTAAKKGLAIARRHVSALRSGAASPMETKCRLLFAEWGLPSPETNVDVTDADGAWLANVDFLWRRHRVIVEYYGAHHAETWDRDILRTRQLEEAGYRVVVILRNDLDAGAPALRAKLVDLLR